jgi:hypothetical protein
MYNLNNEKKTQSLWENLFIVEIQFAIKEQLENLTHMFFFKILNYRLYKEGIFFFMFSHFGMDLKKFNPKNKT